MMDLPYLSRSSYSGLPLGWAGGRQSKLESLHGHWTQSALKGGFRPGSPALRSKKTRVQAAGPVGLGRLDWRARVAAYGGPGDLWTAPGDNHGLPRHRRALDIYWPAPRAGQLGRRCLRSTATSGGTSSLH
ncbi:hypothetical protein GCM10020219_005040 [Nonomuraea dietziae]